MILSVSADKLAIRILVAIATIAWVGIVICLLNSGKAGFGSHLAGWVPDWTILIYLSGLVLALFVLVRTYWGKEGRVSAKEKTAFVYGTSLIWLPPILLILGFILFGHGLRW